MSLTGLTWEGYAEEDCSVRLRELESLLTESKQLPISTYFVGVDEQAAEQLQPVLDKVPDTQVQLLVGTGLHTVSDLSIAHVQSKASKVP